MTPPKGIGGLPPRRIDQQFSQPPVAITPGSQTNVVTATIVQVIGGPNSGIFVYSGAPGPGDLIASLVGATTADQFGNAVNPEALTFYGAAGQQILMGLDGGVAQLIMPTGVTFEGTAANVSAEAVGSGNAQVMEFLISGPKGNAAGGTDWVQIQMASDNKIGSSAAGAAFNYIDTAGTVHAFAQLLSTGFIINTGRINGITPATFGLSNPGATAGAPPTGTATQASSFAAGSPALSYLTAFASTYNTTVAAVQAIVNGLVAWGV